MKRLTIKDIVAGIETFDLKIGVCEEKAFNLLGQYENTGLTPAEVAELAQAKKEFSHLQQESKQLKELLRLAVGDMSIGWLCAVCSKRTKGKEWAMCQYQAFASVFDEERTVTCANFEWQHADKLKGLI